jgi:hypothetical protein
VNNMSLMKKKRSNMIENSLETLENYHIEEIFQYVGELTDFKTVSKKFIPKKCFTSVKFHQLVDICLLMKILATRSYLKTIDLSGYHMMNETIIHMIILMHPQLQLLVLDYCDTLTDFPSPNNSDDDIDLVIHKNATVSWLNMNGPLVSLKGCWKLFTNIDRQNPESITVLFLRGLNNGSIDAMDKIGSFFPQDNQMFVLYERSRLLQSLRAKHKWSVISQETRGNLAVVLTKVEDFSLILWMYKKKAFGRRKLWFLLSINTVNIEKMWLMCKKKFM